MGKRKFTDAFVPENINSKIEGILLELANFEKNKNRNLIKFNAYRKAAAAISKHPTPITSGAEAKKLEGVGLKIAKKIDEILKTGKLTKLEEVRSDKSNQIVQELARVTGIGPSHAHKLMDQGIQSIEDLRKHPELLNHHQQLGLKYFNDFEKRIPREEMEALEKAITKEIRAVDESYRAEVCGSYRRGLPSSGDIDFLITHPNYTSGNKAKNLLEPVITQLESAGIIVDSLARGPSKFMGVCRLQAPAESEKSAPTTTAFRRIDIRLLPLDQYYPALLYFTGSDLFNKRMRLLALEKGFTINEYSIRRVGSTGVPGEPLPVTSEEDIFDYIGMKFLPPEERKQ